MRETGAALFFASPWILGFAVLTGGPVLFSVVLSFTRYDVLTDARYVGLANYQDVFADPVFYRSLLNTGYMVLRIPLIMAVGLAMALLLNSGVRAIGLYRTALYLPVTMPVVASCLLWIWIFNSRASFLNEALRFCIDTAPGARLRVGREPVHRAAISPRRAALAPGSSLQQVRARSS